MVIYLREHNNIILHIVCGDITDVSIQGDTFVICSEQKNVVELLTDPNNFKDLKTAFEFFGCNKIEIRQSEKAQTDEDNIKLLNKYFNDEVIIKQKK